MHPPLGACHSDLLPTILSGTSCGCRQPHGRRNSLPASALRPFRDLSCEPNGLSVQLACQLMSYRIAAH